MERTPYTPSNPPRGNALGENIQRILEQRGESAADLARAIGVFRKTVCFWIRGFAIPDSISRLKLCVYLDITQAQLLSKGPATGAS